VPFNRRFVVPNQRQTGPALYLLTEFTAANPRKPLSLCHCRVDFTLNTPLGTQIRPCDKKISAITNKKKNVWLDVPWHEN